MNKGICDYMIIIDNKHQRENLKINLCGNKIHKFVTFI